MSELFQAAKEISAFMEDRDWSYCIIGGLAVMRWGEPRTTQDVDVTLLTGFGNEERFADALLGEFKARAENPLEMALQCRVLLLKASNGVGMDIALAGFPFEEEIMQRASEYEFEEGCCLKTCSAEDLVVAKAFADRPKDWVDVEGVLIRQTGKLDLDLIMCQLQPLCELKERPEIVDRFRKLLETSR